MHRSPTGSTSRHPPDESTHHLSNDCMAISLWKAMDSPPASTPCHCGRPFLVCVCVCVFFYCCCCCCLCLLVCFLSRRRTSLMLKRLVTSRATTLQSHYIHVVALLARHTVQKKRTVWYWRFWGCARMGWPMRLQLTYDVIV